MVKPDGVRRGLVGEVVKRIESRIEGTNESVTRVVDGVTLKPTRTSEHEWAGGGGQTDD
jgi:GMP synthase PP-ATPase subunit